MSYRAVREGDYAYQVNVALQQRVKNLERENEQLKSGEAYRKLKESRDRWHGKYEKERAGRQRDKVRAEAKIDREVKERTKVLRETAEEAATELERAQRKARKYAEKAQGLKAELEKTKAELAASQAYVKTLEFRLGRNSANSSVPPSKDPVDRKVAHKRNHRKVSGLDPGAQGGHDHHPRRMLEATEKTVPLKEKPPGYKKGGPWRKTDKTVTKLFVGIEVRVPVTPYEAPVWINDETGETWSPPFPFGMTDEINYLPELRAFIFYLTQQMNVAGRKAQAFLEETTNGKLKVSNGWICQLSKEFAGKSKEEVAAIFLKLRNAKVVGVDSTVTRNNGKQECVTVCRNEEAAYFAHTENKGDKAAAAMPCAPGSGFDGDVVSDREPALMKLGNRHQECLVHLSRDLMGLMERETELTWHKDMRSLLLEMLEDRSSWDESGPDPDKVKEWNARYDELVKRGGREYVEHPPTADFLKGYDLRMHFKDSKANILYFLENPAVPPENNGSERDLRQHKRALAAKVTFRKGEYLKAHCDFLTISTTARKNDQPILGTLNAIFERPKPPKPAEPEENKENE